MQVETRLTKQVQAGQMRIATLEATLQDLKQTHADLATDLLSAQAALTATQAECEAAAAALAAAQEELSSAKEQAEALAAEVCQLEDAKLQLLAAQRALKQELAATQVRLTSICELTRLVTRSMLPESPMRFGMPTMVVLEGLAPVVIGLR